MAIKGAVETDAGETRELYIRFNNFDQLTNNNNGVPALARFRGFVSEAAFKSGKRYLWEHVVEIQPPIDWTDVQTQIYAALKSEKLQNEGNTSVPLVANPTDVNN